MRRRLLILGSHPIPYRVPLYQRLAKRADLEILVIYGDVYGVTPRPSRWQVDDFTWDGDPLAGYPHRILWNAAPRPDPSTFLGKLNPSLPWAMWRFAPDAVVVMGYARLYNLLGWGSTKALGARLLYSSDTNAASERAGLRRHLKHAVVERLYRSVDRFLVTGQQNAAHYRAYGVPTQRLVPFPWAIDNDAWRAAADAQRANRTDLRYRWGIAREAPCAVFAGRLAPEKGVDVLIQAAAEVDDLHVLIAGDGPERPRIEARAEALLPDRHTVLGFVNQATLPTVYAAADFMVLPSLYEPWGLVCNEAMACGLPVVATRDVGAAPDLVSEGETGWLARTGDVSDLAATLTRAVEGIRERPEPIRRAVSARIALHSLEAQEKGLLDALA